MNLRRERRDALPDWAGGIRQLARAHEVVLGPVVKAAGARAA